MLTPDSRYLQQPLIALAQTAATAILDIYQANQACPVQTKPDQSPLTQADLTAHQILSVGLHQLTPDIPVLSEEGIDIPWEIRRQWDYYWLIDPLDGTRQFIQHKQEFTINIALIHRHTAIIGLLYVPVTQEIYYADAEAHTSMKVTIRGNTTPLHVRQWQPQHTTILTSQAAHEQRIRELFCHLGTFQQIKMSSAWKFARLAEGKADISPRLGDTAEWDTAAGQCILEQAGGGLFDLQGQPLRYNTRDSLINPHFIALGDVSNLYHRIFS